MPSTSQNTGTFVFLSFGGIFFFLNLEGIIYLISIINQDSLAGKCLVKSVGCSLGRGFKK